MNRLMDFFYPPRCQLCGSQDNLHYAGQLCTFCAADIRINDNACQICAVPLGGVKEVSIDHPAVCGHCTKQLPIFDVCWSPYVYAQPLEWMIHQFKFNARLHFSPLLSDLIAEKLANYINEENKPDVIVPMPLHTRRLRHRGFNQSYLLIKPIAKAMNIPIDLTLCERVRDTAHQTGKNAQQRMRNIKCAFKIKLKKNYRHVVVFDDVVTTGSSVAELSKTLKQAGVQRVDIWCLARAEKII